MFLSCYEFKLKMSFYVPNQVINNLKKGVISHSTYYPTSQHFSEGEIIGRGYTKAL